MHKDERRGSSLSKTQKSSLPRSMLLDMKQRSRLLKSISTSSKIRAASRMTASHISFSNYRQQSRISRPLVHQIKASSSHSRRALQKPLHIRQPWSLPRDILPTRSRHRDNSHLLFGRNVLPALAVFSTLI